MCYIVPTIAAITTTFVWKKNKALKLWWLLLMFYGGSLFGMIDHLWNRELFLVSKDWIKDLGLGVVITAGIILVWVVILVLAKKNPSFDTHLKMAQTR